MQNLFSYPLKLEYMIQAEKTYRLKAGVKECAAIAEVMKVPAVKSFEAEMTVQFHKKECLIDVFGRIKAEVEQTSVVSLENFDKMYESEFSLAVDTKMTSEEQAELERQGEDVPDILDNGQIDLAAMAMEQLALVLDDFPRKEGEVFAFKSEFDEETTKKNNPFAVLENLKK